MLKENRQQNKFVLLLAFFLLYSFIVFAETTGSINVTTQPNATPTTGLFGYTVDFCNTDSDCFGYKCFVDFDGTAGGGKSGWCNATSITSCYSAGTTISSGVLPALTGSGICVSNTTYRTCTNGVWSAATSCASGETCSGNGTCAAAAATTTTTTSGSGAGTGTNATTTTLTPKIQFTQTISDFEIVQGETTTKTVVVNNNGDLALGSVLLELSGITWYTVSPASFSNISKGNSGTFTLTFSPANDTEVKSYSVTATVKTNTTATASFTFNVKVAPSNETIQQQVLPNYDQYLQLIAEYEKNLTELESQGYNVSAAKSILNTLKTKIQEVNQSLAGSDYFSASTTLSEMRVLFDELNSNLANLTKTEKGTDFTIFIAIIIIAVAGVLAYLFWPTKSRETIILKKVETEKQQSSENELLKRLLKKKDEKNV
jgi:hypothetical protein